MAVAKKAPAAKGKGLVNWEEKLAGYAQESAAREASNAMGGNVIGTQGGILKYKNSPVPGNKMKVVILNFALENAMYEGRFDSANPQPPNCFALSMNENELKPHANVEEPYNNVCAGCDMNEWGSADNGVGKACKNIRRLALISAGDLDSADSIAAAEIALLKVPVTSVKAFSGYVLQLQDTLKRPPFGVITEISAVPNSRTQFSLEFKFIEAITESDVFEGLIQKMDAANKQLLTPYAKVDEDAKPRAKAPPPRKGARPAPSKVPAKKSKF